MGARIGIASKQEQRRQPDSYDDVIGYTQRWIERRHDTAPPADTEGFEGAFGLWASYQFGL